MSQSGWRKSEPFFAAIHVNADEFPIGLGQINNAFDQADLLDGAGTAIIIHANSDNFANIPADRYQQIAGGAPGPDEATLATGDGGKRVACGVISAG